MLHPLLEEGMEIKSMNLGLERMVEVDRLLGNPSHAFSTIHVGGTNGKGSVVTKIDAALQLSGKKVGKYISPHLFSFCERMSVDGKYISVQEIDILLRKIIEISPFKLSYFELTTLLAFCYFAEHRIDIAVIEVGLGGRLDATNIITPLLSIITSISLDHCQQLGNSLELIAYEKGGIIKPGIPILLGPKATPYSVFEKIAQEKKSSLMQVEGTFSHYEEENRAIASQALELLSFDEKVIVKAIESVPPYRFKIVSKQVIIDVAHNPDGLERTFERISLLFPQKKIRVVAAFSKDKEITACLKVLTRFSASVTITEANHPRACPVALIEPLGHCQLDPNLSQAFETNYEKAKMRGEILLVCGTFFMMEEIRACGSKLGLAV